MIPLFKVFMSPEAPERVTKVLKSGYIGQGPEVDLFESELENYFKSEHKSILTMNSATSAEHLVYHYLKSPRRLVSNIYSGVAWYEENWSGMGPNDHVLSTPLTCTATNFPISLNGLEIRWVDVDPNSLNMSLDDLESKINEYTRLITVVHWGGNPIDMDRLHNIVRSAEGKFGRKILIIEDCAHSFGATYKGDFVGFTGNISTFSTQAIKHITSVDGGFVVTPFASMYKDFKLLRWYGIDREQPRNDFRCEEDILEAGFKFHMNDVNASIGRSNLEYADTILSQNRENADFYNQALSKIEGIQTIPPVEGSNPAYWLYSILVDQRDNFMKAMGERGVATSKVHARNDKHTCMLPFKSELPGVDKAEQYMVSIPVGWWVKKEHREFIVEQIKKGW